jgi:hypothetical protein
MSFHTKPTKKGSNLHTINAVKCRQNVQNVQKCDLKLQLYIPCIKTVKRGDFVLIKGLQGKERLNGTFKNYIPCVKKDHSVLMTKHFMGARKAKKQRSYV